MAKPTNKNILDDLYTYDVYKVYLLEPTSNLELYSDSLTDTNLQFKEDIKEVRAGVGNKLLTTIPGNKDISLDLTDVKTRLDWIAAKQGADIEVGAATAWHLPKSYIAKAGTEGEFTITLDEEPINQADVRFLKKDESGEWEDVVGTPSGKEVKFATDVAEGDLIYVTGFTYKAPETTQKVVFDTEKTAKAFKVILEGIVFDSKRNPRFKKQYVFHNGVLDGNSEDSTKSERDASQTKTTIKMQIADGRTDLGELLFIPIS